MSLLRVVLQQGKEILQASNKTESAALDAEILLAFALTKARSHLYAWPEAAILSSQYVTYQAYLQRRVAGEPIAYIVGEKEFWSLPLKVSRDTLIPRPDTEVLVETVLQLGQEIDAANVADLGTGSGAIALALAVERPHWQMIASDINPCAIQIAKYNAQQLNVTNVCFLEGSWCEVLAGKKLDIIVSNPPYIAEAEWNDYAIGLQFEPKLALVSGWDGLQAIRIIIDSAKSYLKPGGYLVLEHGITQGEAVRELLAQANYYNIKTMPGLMREERITLGSL